MILATWRAFLPDARRFLCGALLLEVGHGFLWVLQNLYVRSLGFGEADAGTVLSAAGIGVVLTTIPAAALYDALGARRCLVLAATGAAAGLLGFALSESLPALLFWSAVQSASFTVHRVVAAPFLVSVGHPGQRTQLFGAEFMTHTVAAAFGLACAGALADLLVHAGLGESEGLSAALALGALASLCATIPYRGLVTGRRREPTAAEAPTATRPASPPSVWRMFAILAPRHWHLWWRLALPYLIVGTGAGLIIPFINLYVTDRFARPKNELGLVM
ncbi:MAG: MFS transporter, partial [Planctomycetes bacterium]|nr:MFS transporter [Planctomycetota bacterium]